MAADLFYLPFRPAIDPNGLTVPGAKLFFYLTGSLTPAPVFTTDALTTPLQHPVEANSAGAWPMIYLDRDVIYRVILQDGDGAVLNDADPYIPGVTDSTTLLIQELVIEAQSSAVAAGESREQAEAEADRAEVAADLAQAASSGAGYSGTSTTSVTIGTGSKSFTTQTGKSFYAGQSVRVARTSDPANYMDGQVTAYNTSTGLLTVNVTSVAGSGSGVSDWTIGMLATVMARTWVQIGTVPTTSGTTATFSSIPQTYSDLLFVWEGVSHNNGTAVACRIELSSDGAAWSTALTCTTGIPNADIAHGSIFIPLYTGTTGQIVSCIGIVAAASAATNITSNSLAAWRVAGIRHVRFSPISGSFDAGTITLYAR